MKYRRRIILLIILFVSLLHGVSAAITIRITGRWQDKLDAVNLTGGAGSDFANPFESATNAVSMTISKTAVPAVTWQVLVKRVDTAWSPNFRIYVKITNPGTGGSITGGTTYFEITTVDQELFRGTGDISKIELQYKIDGFSVANALIATYDTEIYYTIVEPAPPP